MTDADLRRHCAEIDRCNQRGGRMLSVVDLVEAGTFDRHGRPRSSGRDLAAYALAAIGNGASFMVGANPGGAGKTTVMGALLNFVPADVELVAADGLETIRQGLAPAGGRRCYICHEIGAGGYCAYLWGEALRAYFDLPTAGHILATNLHADTYEEAHDQVCNQNGVTEEAFRRMNLLFFLSVRRTGLSLDRRIATLWESDGTDPHRLLFTDGTLDLTATRLVSPDDLAHARATIDGLLDSGARTIQDVRKAVLDS